MPRLPFNGRTAMRGLEIILACLALTLAAASLIGCHLREIGKDHFLDHSENNRDAP